MMYLPELYLYSAKKKYYPHIFNVECCKLHERSNLKFFRGMLLNGHPGGFFFKADCQKKGLNFSSGDVTSIETVVW